MNNLVRIFKNCAAQACGHDGRELRRLMNDFGLGEALETANEQCLSARQLAIVVLWECCCTDGRFNNCLSGLRATLGFLAEAIEKPDALAVQDLGKLLKGGTTKEQIEKWLEAHFPI